MSPKTFHIFWVLNRHELRYFTHALIYTYVISSFYFILHKHMLHEKSMSCTNHCCINILRVNVLPCIMLFHAIQSHAIHVNIYHACYMLYAQQAICFCMPCHTITLFYATQAHACSKYHMIHVMPRHVTQTHATREFKIRPN